MSAIVKINDTDMQVIEYEGQRVATLAQIDSVHGRPEGTARRTFNTNRRHLLEGEDFFKMSADEFRTRFPGVISDRATEDVTLIFESGCPDRRIEAAHQPPACRSRSLGR